MRFVIQVKIGAVFYWDQYTDDKYRKRRTHIFGKF